MDRDDLVQALAATPVVLARLTDGMSEQHLRAGHGPAQWSVKELVFHLRDVDEVFLGRFQRMAAEQDPFLPAFDQEAYARDRNYQDGNAAQALADFAMFRGRMVELLRTVDLSRGGRHEETGHITIGGAAEHLVSHDLQHLRQIAESGAQQAERT
jgi:uncharacterized damage-inducible protein DinB